MINESPLKKEISLDKRVLGIDVGSKIYGIALLNIYYDDCFAITPLKNLKSYKGFIGIEVFDKFIKQYKITDIVLGHPGHNFQGSINTITKLIEVSFTKISARYPFIGVFIIDESYSSWQAREYCSTYQYDDDSLSACIILSRWYDKYYKC